ncbi:putative ring finger domain protein [Phaeomoniella chlamydospora]|uniref:Putative ring finger domain protein n=1 Tax=Phaeomoniella chlamydospora TaxID=158046 RepID=A0A0G2GJY6_PHACM|nr:putative ring finger domain protein [Phaeomoniella chlamydospora]
MTSINSRKGQTSITHLMNFALPPRPQYQSHYHHHNSRVQRRPTWGLGSGYHAIDKARYVHANYRFIVRADKDYRAQAVDADVHLDWNNVLQVLASAQTQLASCPICLSTPVAPRMAKCGHIFCLPCLIRFMHSSDDTDMVSEKRARWKKCPICEDSIYISEARPVRWFVGQEASMLKEGGDVLLRLLKREPGSTFALPRDASYSLPTAEDIPWFHVAEVMDYARFIKGGEDYMIAEYDSEVDAITRQEQEDELMFGDDSTWTRKAVSAIVDAKEKIKGIGNPPSPSKERLEKRVQKTPVKFEQLAGGAPDMYQVQTAMKSGHNPPERLETSTVETASTTNISNIHNSPLTSQIAEGLKSVQLSDDSNTIQQNTSKPTNKTHHLPARQQGTPFYFYQALPNFYLSPLDIRILRAAFGDFASFPTTILPRIEHISTGHIVDDDLRKRAKYLAHLPFGCEVSFLECDWTGSVNVEILQEFGTEIERRRKRNREKEAREEKERIRAEKEEDEKRYAFARRRRPSVVEKSFSEHDFQPLVPIAGSPSFEGSRLSSSPPWQNNRAHSAFASLATPGTSPDAPKTVWGTAAVQSSSPQLHAVPDHGPVGDGWLQDWERDLLDHDDPVAMVEASMAAEGSKAPAASGGGGRKKKNKKITLMSTSNARRGA